MQDQLIDAESAAQGVLSQQRCAQGHVEHAR
jgi:hypothetical protein